MNRRSFLAGSLALPLLGRTRPRPRPRHRSDAMPTAYKFTTTIVMPAGSRPGVSQQLPVFPYVTYLDWWAAWPQSGIRAADSLRVYVQTRPPQTQPHDQGQGAIDYRQYESPIDLVSADGTLSADYALQVPPDVMWRADYQFPILVPTGDTPWFVYSSNAANAGDTIVVNVQLSDAP